MDNVKVSSMVTGIPIAAEDIGGVEYQRAKIVDGRASGTTGWPVDAVYGGLVDVARVQGSVQVSGTVSVSGAVNVSGTVTVRDGASVTIQQGASVLAQVSAAAFTTDVPGATATGLVVRVAGSVVDLGSVSLSGTGLVSVVPGVSVVAQISGTVTIGPTTLTVNTAPTVAGASITIQQGASVSAQVSGTITAVLPGSTTGSSGVSGALVWLGASQTINIANVSTILGTAVFSLVPGVSVIAQISGTVTIGPTILTVNTAPTVAGASVTIQQGASVSAVVSGTVSALLPGSTTGASGMSGVLVWLGANQTMNIANVSTVLGTQIVSVVPGVSVVAQISAAAFTTDAPGATATAMVVRIAGSAVEIGTVSISGTAIVSVVPGVSVTIQQGASVSAQVSGTISVSGTAIVSVVPGVSVNIGSQATGIYTTTATSGVTGPIVWLGVGQTIATIQTVGTILGTQVVSVVPGLSVSAVVSGTITALLPGSTTGSSGMSGVLVWLGASQTVNIANVSTILGTQIVSVVPGLSVSAVVSGTVTAVLPGSTTGSSGVSGVLVWLGANQTMNIANVSTILGTQIVSIVPGVSVTIQAGVSVSAVVSGTVTALLPGSTTGSSGMSGVLVWLGVSQTINVANVSTILGTAVVSVVPGLSVSAVVSGTVTAILPNLTTAAPSISATGLMVWIAGGQGTTVVPVFVTGTVTAGAGTTVVSGTVTAILPGSTTGSSGMSGVLVWLGVSQTINVANVSTILGTAVVSVVPGVSVTIQQGASVVGTVQPLYSTTASPGAAATGEIVWVANPGAGVGTTVLTVQTILGTAVVSVVPGVSVNIGSQATGIYTTTATSGATGPIVWLGVGQTIATIQTVATILGTQVVSIVPGVSVNIGSQATGIYTTTATSGVTGPIVWLGVGQTIATIQTIGTLLGTAVVSVVPGVSVLASITVSAVVGTVITLVNMPYVTTAWATGVSTALVVIAKDVARTNFIMNVTSTIAGASSMLLFTVMTGNTTGAAAGTSLYVVPAGRILCIQNMYAVLVSSAVLGPAQLVVVVGAAAASVSLTATVGMAAVFPYAIQGTTAVYSIALGNDYISAGSTMGLAMSGTSHSILGIMIQGYLF